MIKTILIKPNGNNTYNTSLHNIKAIEPPLWLSILANKYSDCKIIDAELNNYSTKETIMQVLSYHPKKVVILASGNHPSAYVQQKEEVDKLKKGIESDLIKVEVHYTLPCNIIEYGTPRLSLLNYNNYKCHNWHSWSNDCIRSPYGVLFTSISCPYKCSFCAIKSYYGENYKERPLKDIFVDLNYFAKAKIVNIKIIDELFIFKKKRVIDICNYIISKGYKFNIWAYARIDIMDEEILKKLKKAGVNWLCYGIESGSDEIRKSVMKGIFNKNKIREIIKLSKDNGINCLGNFMFGFWEDNLDTMQETLDFARELNCEFINFYSVVAYPNSILYDEMKDKGIGLPKDYREYGQMGENFKPLPTKYLTNLEVLKFRDEAFLNYFTSSKYLFMMKKTFGDKVVNEILEMIKLPIKRNLK